MESHTSPEFKSTEDELAYLREQIATKERELAERSAEVDASDLEVVGKEVLQEYSSFTPNLVLNKEHQMSESELTHSQHRVEVAQDAVEEMLTLVEERGVYNALRVLEQQNAPRLTDEVHRRLVEQIRNGVVVQQLREGSPAWQLLHMSLFQVTLPEVAAQEGRETQLAILIGAMQQWMAGMHTVLADERKLHLVLEIAVAAESDDIVFYVAVPNDYISLFEKQTLSLFPHAQIELCAHDYNIFVADGFTEVSVGSLARAPVYPLRTHEAFSTDPLEVMLNAFSKLEQSKGGAALQFVIQTPRQDYTKLYRGIIERVQQGMRPSDAIERSTLGGEFMASLGEFFFSKNSTSADKESYTVDQEALEQFRSKTSAAILDVEVRTVVSATERETARTIRSEIEAAFHQFTAPEGNKLTFRRLSGTAARRASKAFSFREKGKRHLLPLNQDELATLVHFPAHGVLGTPQFKQSHARTAAAPNELPADGTLLGSNVHRNTNRSVYITPEDRLRHFYVIGQTGTGKTTLMKNMITQDIAAGSGVCMIDPHGSDIDDVLASIPPEREQDIIYFDPSYSDYVMGLNMLEFDPNRPEQKTFVVNELFSIFQKLYASTPEAMGPMFEQYFRNATLLVMEDPESGNTLLDISRVLSDTQYRNYKLARATNPVVVQFWREIATKAGGQASLENIVPYIVSKFDVFTANDYIRPIIGQPTSSFDFRRVMDEQKILLVNLAKGRLGDINANLIGMIVVGKILMAALSRVDDHTGTLPPFYLHMDEFQNVSTDSISAILSEARKYRLGLTLAHQFVAQLDPTIKDAVFGNVGSLAAFRVGSEDAAALEHQFSPTFSAHDLMQVPNRNAYVRLLAHGAPLTPFSIQTNPPAEPNIDDCTERIRASYHRYGRPRQEVDAEIRARYHMG
jgi:hypothetical protein